MTSALRVLYIHPFAAHSGSVKSLVGMITALPHGGMHGTAVVSSGASAELLASAGLEVIPVRGIAQWDDTRFGHYRGWRWLILLREVAYWPATIKGLREAARRGPYDLIHCNEITSLLVGVLAKRMLRAPLLVHVRSLQRSPAGSHMSAFLQRLLRNRADAVVAIDEAVRRSLPADQPVEVIYNGMAVPTGLPSREGDDRFCVGIVGVLHRSKGIYELIEAARILRDRGVVVRVLVVGENVRRLSGARGWLLRKFDLARDVRGDLEAFVVRHSLQDLVEFTGFVADIGPIYSRTDVICFPSHLDAPGRPVFEAALFGRPTIVAMRNPTCDVVIPGETGLCIDEPTPMAIADAIEAMARDRDAARAMGARARCMALTRFDSRVSALKMLELYRRICTRSLAVGATSSHGGGVVPPPASR
jgi:glycosyltransferase involved in cell wall biosynthesis